MGQVFAQPSLALVTLSLSVSVRAVNEAEQRTAVTTVNTDFPIRLQFF
jgi:hypothetical protein